MKICVNGPLHHAARGFNPELITSAIRVNCFILCRGKQIFNDSN